MKRSYTLLQIIICTLYYQMKEAQGKMSLYDKLPEYGKELLRSLDATHELDRLECLICSHYFNFENKKPVLICKNKTCAYQHGVCEQCLKVSLQPIINNEIEGPLKCFFCKQDCHNNYEYDESRFQLIKKLSKVIETLAQISKNTKLLTQKQTEKKLKQIVERAEKDIFKTSLESKKKTFLLDRLKKRINRSQQQSKKILQDVEIREHDLMVRQNNFKIMMEDIMNRQKQLQQKNSEKDERIRQLQDENHNLKRRLAQFQDIQSLQNRRVTGRNRLRTQRRPNTLYTDDYYFTQFNFIPRRDDSFIQNFNQNKSTHVIELKRGRQKYFNAIGERKMAFHSEMFNFGNEEHKLICFQINSINKNVTRYKFGLADQAYRQIKNANLSIHLQQIEENEPLIIVFYLNLIKMKLYATSKKCRKCEDLPKGLNLSKFTIFLYFADINTQITLEK